MRDPVKPVPPKPCPVCQVAMQTTRNGSSIVHQCKRCGTVITVGKPSHAPEQRPNQ